MKLQDLRAKIDAIDARMVELLNRRTKLVQQIGSLKKASGMNVLDPKREESLLASLETKNKGPLPQSALRAIYKEILATSRNVQKQFYVACLGPEGSYSHQAAQSRFGSENQYIFCRTIPDIFSKVSKEEVDLAVIPIENSTEGGVNSAYDSFINTDLVIYGELYLRIQHMLCASEQHRAIQRIYSHPQAFGQCKQWLQNHYPYAELIEVSSTSEGARRTVDDLDSAAITSALSSEIHHLKILSPAINDIVGNTTRFLVLSRTAAKPSRKDKTSLLFAVSHEIGALSQVLAIFSQSNLNLQKIESRPAPLKAWEYLFFVDVSSNHQKPAFRKALQQIHKKTLWLKILGSYPEGNSHV